MKSTGRRPSRRRRRSRSANFAPRGLRRSRTFLTGRPGPASPPPSKRPSFSPCSTARRQLKLNAVIFQVRPACDALYASALEPWSEYLTGAQGRAPLAVLRSARLRHHRGAQARAGIARVVQSIPRPPFSKRQSPLAPNHISRTHPELVRSYGRYLWLDPGDPAVREYSLRVVMDVVRRYDVDGVHFDDYFYPYPRKMRRDATLIFPTTQPGKNSGFPADSPATTGGGATWTCSLSKCITPSRPGSRG